MDVKTLSEVKVALLCDLPSKSTILPSDVQEFRVIALEASSVPLSMESEERTVKLIPSSTITQFADRLTAIQNIPLTDAEKSSFNTDCDKIMAESIGK